MGKRTLSKAWLRLRAMPAWGWLALLLGLIGLLALAWGGHDAL
ncbi:hypothetical protein [Rhodanobacter lindaniclasticus]